ncbi:MAG: hypothetical protein ACK4ZJ_19190, partial [Allorhizobium sp.]
IAALTTLHENMVRAKAEAIPPVHIPELGSHTEVPSNDVITGYFARLQDELVALVELMSTLRYGMLCAAQQ